MEYTLRTDIEIANKTPYQPPSEFSELYYYYSNHYALRIVIVCLWIVLCYFSGRRMCSDGTTEGDQRDHTLFRFGFVYGASMMLSHAFILVHQVIDKTYGHGVVKDSSRWLIVIAMLTSIFVRTLMLLYIYSRMEFALAGYRYPITSGVLGYCISFCTHLAMLVSIFKCAASSSFQLVVNVDGFSYIVVLFLLFLCLKILFNDVTRFVGLNSRVVHVRVVVSYALLALVISFLSLFSSDLTIVRDFVLNFQIFLILSFFLTADLYFGSMDTPHDCGEEDLSSEKVLLKPFSTIIKNFTIPNSSPPEPSAVNTEEPSALELLAQETSPKASILYFKIPITSQHIPKESSVRSSLVESSIEGWILVNMPFVLSKGIVAGLMFSQRRPYDELPPDRVHLRVDYHPPTITSPGSGDTSEIPSSSGRLDAQRSGAHPYYPLSQRGAPPSRSVPLSPAAGPSTAEDLSSSPLSDNSGITRETRL